MGLAIRGWCGGGRGWVHRGVAGGVGSEGRPRGAWFRPARAGMSLHTGSGSWGGAEVRFTVGWHAFCGHFFLEVWTPESEAADPENGLPADVYSSYRDGALWGLVRGRSRRQEGGLSLEELTAKLVALGVALPVGLLGELEVDMRSEVGACRSAARV